MEGTKNYMFSLTPLLTYSFTQEKLFDGKRTGQDA